MSPKSPKNPILGAWIGISTFKRNMRKIWVAYFQICVSDWHEIWQAAAASNRDFMGGLVWWYNNSKMADDRHFENRYIAISQWKIIRQCGGHCCALRRGSRVVGCDARLCVDIQSARNKCRPSLHVPHALCVISDRCSPLIPLSRLPHPLLVQGWTVLLPSYDSTSIYWRLRAGSRRVT